MNFLVVISHFVFFSEMSFVKEMSEGNYLC